MTFETPTALLEPVAEVRYAFDEQKERAAFTEQVERYREGRDQAFDARLEMGKILLRAQQMWPNVLTGHKGTREYSPQFLTFALALPKLKGEGTISRGSITVLLGYARNPKRLERHRAFVKTYEAGRSRGRAIPLARKMRLAIRNGATLEELEAALTEIIGDAQVQHAA